MYVLELIMKECACKTTIYLIEDLVVASKIAQEESKGLMYKEPESSITLNMIEMSSKDLKKHPFVMWDGDDEVIYKKVREFKCHRACNL